ncbi:enhanced serine sensitivity protein SseB C-terminal domain-containing protein [Anaeromicropila herbilytica]|uniref:SseB protein C-terminal domain-containing protein n=1 Tax=Anaeromicropila herbilytica TaxID=2785025 RepID=A0A7R7EP71_9FIRM|nr:enhanced serine sensitivity protein SseB C-terminal domain-containing protein [Anaeromicropila herbilytica]BCN32369.1 hypothetical protein bsdtb5_36640 [Anaeromicropila herbilytica]
MSENIILERKVIDYLKLKKDNISKDFSEQQVAKDTKVILGEPKEYPYQMVDAIKQYSLTNNEIMRIWLRLMLRDGKQSYLVILDCKGNLNEIYKNIASVSKKFTNGLPIDFVTIEKAFGKSAVENQVPIYQSNW